MDNFIKEIERLLKNNDIQKVKDKCNDIIEKEEKNIEQKQTNANTFYNLALSYYYLYRADYNEDYYNKAIKFCDESINKETNNKANAHYIKGFVNYYAGKYADAIEEYDQTLVLYKNHYYAIYAKAMSLSMLKKYDEAINIIEEYKKSTANQDNEYSKYHIEYFYYCKIILELKNNICNYENILNYLDKIDNFATNAVMSIINIVSGMEKGENYIDNIFKILINKDNIWKNNKIFASIMKCINNDSQFNIIKNNIKTNLLYQYRLLSVLSFNNPLLSEYYSNKININHYLTLNTLMILLNENQNDKVNSNNMRITNIITANDSKEGKMLEDIFAKKGKKVKMKNIDNLISFQTSFSRNTDSLTMFRLYGKSNNQEFTGASLVIKNDYFNSDDDNFQYNSNDIFSKNINFKKNLYWILYYNEEENILIFNPTNSKYTNVVIDLNKIDTKEYEDKRYEYIVNIIKSVFNNIFETIDYINNNIKDENIKSDIFSYLFENIRYLIKHEAFLKSRN